jgi:hypothetical protein
MRNQTEPIEMPLPLSDMREVAESALEMLHDALPAAMKPLGLRAYVDPAYPHRYWMGLDHPQVPEHDRWFFMVENRAAARKESGRVGIYTVNAKFDAEGSLAFRPVRHCATGLHGVQSDGWDGEKDLIEVLWHLFDEIQDALNDAPQSLAGAFKADERMRKLMLMYQAFGYLGIDYSNELLPLTWDQNLHDLLHHYDGWVARNPEAQDLPRDLVLRMHGLKDYADHLATGLDWLNVYPEDEPYEVEFLG